MRLISLNAWCGIRWEQLTGFIKGLADKTDIFCFQEVRNGGYKNGDRPPLEHEEFYADMQTLLPDYIGHYIPMVPGVGLASFVRKNIVVEKVESSLILSAEETRHLKRADGSNYYPRVMQTIFLGDGLIVHNFHGIPGGSKGDTPERGVQTKRVLERIVGDRPNILVGDFNLDMDTAAIMKFEEHGMRNLVREGAFKTTRNANYVKQIVMPFADYAFVTSGLKVIDFRVLQDDVSDHLPLSLEFTH
ncbi:MAG: endonuclease/exonuclease/phosphatase family protein [Bacillota bacterium]